MYIELFMYVCVCMYSELYKRDKSLLRELNRRGDIHMWIYYWVENKRRNEWNRKNDGGKNINEIN